MPVCTDCELSIAEFEPGAPPPLLPVSHGIRDQDDAPNSPRPTTHTCPRIGYAGLQSWRERNFTTKDGRVLKWEGPLSDTEDDDSEIELAYREMHRGDTRSTIALGILWALRVRLAHRRWSMMIGSDLANAKLCATQLVAVESNDAA